VRLGVAVSSETRVMFFSCAYGWWWRGSERRCVRGCARRGACMRGAWLGGCRAARCAYAACVDARYTTNAAVLEVGAVRQCPAVWNDAFCSCGERGNKAHVNGV